MSVVEGGPNTAGLIARVQNILLKPKEEWAVIQGETATVQGLFTGYAVILAAIPAVAGAIGSFLLLHNPIAAVISAALGYVLGLVGVFVTGFIINALAPSFGGTADQTQAMKVAVYASTAAWVAGILNIVPFLGILAVIGALYGLYLFYLGAPMLMKVPQDKAVGFVVVVIIVEIVVYFAIGMLVGMVVAMATVGAAVGAATAVH
jgi:hypothetical protein